MHLAIPIRLSAAALAVITLSACVQVLGNPFVVVEDDDGKSGGPSGSGGMSSSGGFGGQASVGGGMGQGGQDDPLDKPGCDVFDLDICGPSHKCSVVNVVTGIRNCVPRGVRGAFVMCTDDTQCQAGMLCSPLHGVCKPYCDSSKICDVGSCNALHHTSGQSIPNMGACEANCDPITSAPCQLPQASCHFVGAPGGSGYDCVAAGNVGLGGTCSAPPPNDFSAICAPGLDCFSSGGTSSCKQVCAPHGQSAGCPANENCGGVPITQNGTTYGQCG